MIGKNYIGTPITGINPYYFIFYSFILVIFIGFLDWLLVKYYEISFILINKRLFID